MATFGRKSAYKRAYKDAEHDGLRRPKRKPMISTKYYERGNAGGYLDE